MQIWDIWRINFVIPVSLQMILGLKNMVANYAELGSFFNLKLWILNNK
jgi:hypothetical protein